VVYSSIRIIDFVLLAEPTHSESHPVQEVLSKRGKRLNVIPMLKLADVDLRPQGLGHPSEDPEE
jgi:hypothetical protein